MQWLIVPTLPREFEAIPTLYYNGVKFKSRLWSVWVTLCTALLCPLNTRIACRAVWKWKFVSNETWCFFTRSFRYKRFKVALYHFQYYFFNLTLVRSVSNTEDVRCTKWVYETVFIFYFRVVIWKNTLFLVLIVKFVTKSNISVCDIDSTLLYYVIMTA